MTVGLSTSPDSLQGVLVANKALANGDHCNGQTTARRQDCRDILELAEIVQRQAAVLKAVCEDNSFASPSLDTPFPDRLTDLPQPTRLKLREAAKAIHDIATGPFDHLFSIAWSGIATLRWSIHFKIPQAVPLQGKASYASIAASCGVQAPQLNRILRMCMVSRLFWEPEPDHVAHTIYSASLVTDKVLLGELEFLCEDTYPISTKLVEAHEQWSGSDAANHAAFNAAWHTDLPRYPWLHQQGHEENAKRFTNMLEFARQERATDVRFVAQGYAWDTVETLIDIGGGSGDVALSLIKAYPYLQIVVEDQAHSIELGKASLPTALHKSIELFERDFLQPRAEESDDVAKTRSYFLRMVLHNWSDQDVPKIITPLLPSMRAGARLLNMEVMAAPPGHLPEALEWWMRSLDMEMMIEFNSRLRSKQDWQNLFANIDQRIIMRSAKTPLGSGLTIMEFGFEQ